MAPFLLEQLDKLDIDSYPTLKQQRELLNFKGDFLQIDERIGNTDLCEKKDGKKEDKATRLQKECQRRALQCLSLEEKHKYLCGPFSKLGFAPVLRRYMERKADRMLSRRNKHNKKVEGQLERRIGTLQRMVDREGARQLRRQMRGMSCWEI